MWTLIEASLLQHGDYVAFLDSLPLLHPDLLDRAGARRLDGDLHLHRLEHDHRVAGRHPVARLRRDLEDHPRDVRLDLLSHQRLLVRAAACEPDPSRTRYSR